MFIVTSKAKTDSAIESGRGVISLRYYYAAEAMHGLLAANSFVPRGASSSQEFLDMLVSASFNMADAMLAGREKQPS